MKIIKTSANELKKKMRIKYRKKIYLFTMN